MPGYDGAVMLAIVRITSNKNNIVKGLNVKLMKGWSFHVFPPLKKVENDVEGMCKIAVNRDSK